MIDLHVHSSASDGSFSPSQLILLAKEKGLTALALTDHDTLSGLDEFERTALETGYKNIVPGVEISVKIPNASLHICGLFVCRHNVELQKLLSWIRDKRNDRNLKIAEKLSNAGYAITIDEVLNFAGGESVGRPHFAKVLIGKGYFSRTQDVFDNALKRGCFAYVPRELPSPEEAILAIHNAGGLAFWAHPLTKDSFSKTQFKNLLRELSAIGLDGIEAYYTTYDKETQNYLLSLAAQENILVSGGSDFHGANMDGVEIGIGAGTLNIPDSVYENILKNKNQSTSSNKK
jgi:predicted metal-dependent phosphoesterase TrpH